MTRSAHNHEIAKSTDGFWYVAGGGGKQATGVAELIALGISVKRQVAFLN